MPCKHLKELYALCRSQNLKLSSSDLIRVVCTECGIEEVCPSVLCEQCEAKYGEKTRERAEEP